MQTSRATVIELREQLESVVRAPAETVLSTSVKLKHLGRRYEILQGLYVTVESSYHTAVTHASIGATLRTILALCQKDIGTKLIRFTGVHISFLQKQTNEKRRKGKSEYTLALGGKQYLDCFEAQLSGQCLASKSNIWL